jgi:hypothetical protein
MTGPEHYREAERLMSIPTNERRLEMAQVHATLALAAATAATIANASFNQAWHEAGAW